MSITEYHFVPNVSGGLRLVCITDSGISSIHGGNATLLPFERVTGVKLSFRPTPADAKRFCCEISGRPGIVISIQSTTCEGDRRFVSQSAAYRALVMKLHEQLSMHNPGVDYLKDVSWRFFRSKESREYDPLSIPDELLPPSGAMEGIASSQTPPPLPAFDPSPNHSGIEADLARALANPAVSGEPPPGGGRWYCMEDFGPIAEPGDSSWYGAAGTSTHWADATQYAEEANEKLKAGLIGPPLDPAPQGERPL